MHLALTQTDISIDILVALLWLLPISRALWLVFQDFACPRMKIISAIIFSMGVIYVYQASYTLVTGHRGVALIWDIFNMLVVLGSNIVTLQWSKGRSVEWNKDIEKTHD